MNANFYDIESLTNVFSLANFDENKNHVDIYLLCDTPALLSSPNWQAEMLDRIYERNHNFTGTASFYDLHTEIAGRHLAETFGCSDANSINNPDSESSYDKSFRLVCDTDANYDSDRHPYLMGYNSYNYDTTMLALYLYEAWTIVTQHEYDREFMEQKTPLITYTPPTAEMMRSYNDDLFSKQFKEAMPSYLVYDATDPYHRNYSDKRYLIRKNMISSGRHLDVARLNEKQSKLALKRILGMLGFQILESNKLKRNQTVIENADQLYELIAYNVSDVINLKNLFHHKKYQADFKLKLGLLTSYPELIHEKMEHEYKPNISPYTVRRDRLTIDSSSAQLATKCLCPYGHLKDIETVSFDYPAENIAKKLGIKRVNVLDETKKFFYGLYPQPEIRAQFDVIYNWYKQIEGKNFNDSKNYKLDYGEQAICHKLSEIPKPESFMPYYDGDGNPTSCYVIFSVGGVHGAEYNKALYDSDMKKYQAIANDMQEAMEQFPNPVDLRKAKTIHMADGRELPYKTFLQSGKRVEASEYKDITKLKPVLYRKNKEGMTELNKKYTYTSADASNHEDFTSYYPNLLRMMQAFFNTGLGYDRYAEIFDQKERYGKLRKDKTLSEAERDSYSNLREGTKLILNSASGAADAAFNNNIRVNNQIISMRIIGQLFSWRIGQSQSYHGAKVTSTNTDGLYSALDKDLNDKILAQESKDIGVAIEPEPLYLISKDANNRIELSEDLSKIISASGVTLGCRKGPTPLKSLAHPAILDWALCEYLIVASQHYKGLSLDAPFNDDIGRSILKSAIHKFEPKQFLLMMQNVIASSEASYNFIFGLTDVNPNEPIILQHYNRIFIMKDGTPNTMHLWSANAKTITPATKTKRIRDGVRSVSIEPMAMNVLKAQGVTEVPFDRDVVQKKVTNIDSDWSILILNNDLDYLTQEEYDFIVNNLDYEKYLDKLHTSFEDNWRNMVA